MNIRRFIEDNIKIIKGILTITAFVSATIVVYAYFEKFPKKEDMQEMIRDEVKPIVDEMSLIKDNQSTMLDNDKILRNSLVEEFRKQNKTDQIINLLNQFNDELKKNDFQIQSLR